MDTLPQLSCRGTLFSRVAPWSKEASQTLLSIWRMETRAFYTSKHESLQTTLSRESVYLCGTGPCQKVNTHIPAAVIAGNKCLLTESNHVGRSNAVAICYSGKLARDKALQIRNFQPGGRLEKFSERKPFLQYRIVKTQRGNLFNLFKRKRENQEELDLEASKIIQQVKKWSNLKFVEGALYHVKLLASGVSLQVIQESGNIKKNYVLEIVGVSLLLLVLGLTLEPQPSVAAVATDALSLETKFEEAVELPPIPTEFPRLRDLSLPAFEKVVLPNGLRVFLLEDHELGLVGGQLLVKGGSKDDPIEKVGLAAISSFVQRSGGTIEHPADILDMKLEAMAARIETSSSVSETSVGFRCLTEDLPQVISLFSEVVQQPLMARDKLELTRTQFLGSIQRRGDNPEGIAAREFPKILYGDGSVYARYPTKDTLKSITQEDLLAFHAKTFSPTASVLGIWGDFDRSMLKAAIEENFGSWNGGNDEDQKRLLGPSTMNGVSLSESEFGSSIFDPNVYIIDRPGLSQGFVRMGELGTTLADPDVFALDVLNDILNGFGGLLFDQVRSKEGLAYSVYGGWTPAVEHRGSFLAGGETRIESVIQFVQAVDRVLGSVTQLPPSEEMLGRAKEGIINSFVFNFVDSGAQLSRVMTYELFGIDQNFIFNYKKKVEELTSNEILQAAQRHLHPHSQPILIVTDVSKLEPRLQSLRDKVVPLQPDYLFDQ